MKKLLITIFFTLSCINAQTLTGYVISDNEKVISSKFVGLIKKVYVNEGDFVKKGELLYEIDSSSIDSKRKELELNLNIQKDRLSNIKTNYERYKRLLKKDLVSKYEVEQLQLNLLNTKDMIYITKARLRDINNQYKYLKIKSPNNALVIKKGINEGEIAMPSVPAIMLSDLSKLKIKTSINESNLKNIKLKDKVEILIDSINFKTTGEISSIIPSLNATSHSFILKISFDKKDENIYPGMYTKIVLK